MSARSAVCLLCSTKIAPTRSGLCLACYRARVSQAAPALMAPLPTPPPTPEKVLASDRRVRTLERELTDLKHRYKESLADLARRESELGTVTALNNGLETFTITPNARLSPATSEATAIMVASDWHIEENVGSEIGGLNKYNLEIAKTRAVNFFRNGMRLVQLLSQDIAIPTIVLALLGDFISNDIHEEFPEVNELQPNHALVAAQNLIASGIEYMLANTEASLVIPCHSGNHARTTRTTRFGAENGHSLEYLMYLGLQTYFRSEPRVTFIIPDGMHSYVKVYDKTVRFQHGHAIKYGGGVGGIYIPVNKAIAQWNKGRHADLDIFGHFHQMRDGGNFLCNGSLIGYNAFALSIKADYEPPKQVLTLIDRKRGRTCTWPILPEEKK